MKTTLVVSCFFICGLLYGDNKAMRQKKHIAAAVNYLPKHKALANQSSVNVLIQGIETAGFFDGNTTFINWGEGYAYNCYERLLEVAPDTTWLRLGSSTNPVTRYYACRALYQKHSPYAKALQQKLLKDSTLLGMQSCDLQLTLPLSYFVAAMAK